MEKLYEKVENLKQQINEEKIIKELKSLKEEISKDKHLVDLITKYHETQDEKIKLEIIKNKVFRQYKERETELNLLIMYLNQELKKITKKGICNL